MDNMIFSLPSFLNHEIMTSITFKLEFQYIFYRYMISPAELQFLE